MSVYRELAAELRANKAVIDSLNSRNQQLTAQNQRLKQEIHNFVQSTLNLGQFAGTTRQTAHSELPKSSDILPEKIEPNTIANIVRAQGEARKVAADSTVYLAAPQSYTEPTADTSVTNTFTQLGLQQHRVPSPIQKTATSGSTFLADDSERIPTLKRQTAKPVASTTHSSTVRGSTARSKTNSRQQAPARQKTGSQSEMIPQAQVLPKLFTEQSGERLDLALDSKGDKEIGGIWLALSIILIIVTAFGAGFLIMKPLLNDR